MEPALSLRMQTEPMLVCACRGMLKPVLARLDLHGDKVDAIVLAVDEAVTNAMRHSYEGRRNEFLTVTCAFDADWIEITVSDTGRTADRKRIARKDPEQVTAQSVTPGGLGVQLMYDICDEVAFTPVEPHGNRVVLRIKRPAVVKEG